MMKEELTLPDFEVCIHCSNPFQSNYPSYCENDENEKNCQDRSVDRESKISNLTSSSSLSLESKASLTTALSTIFKLNYLTAFPTKTITENEEDELLWSLCLGCSDVLTNLYQLYNDFLQLGQINSNLSKKMDRLDEIMECHLQHKINCDLIHTVKEKHMNEVVLVDSEQNHDKSIFMNSSSNLPNDNDNNNLTLVHKNDPGESSSIIFKREPRLILTRLSAEKYTSQKEFGDGHKEYEGDNFPFDDDFVSSDEAEFKECPVLGEKLLESGAEMTKTREEEGNLNAVDSSLSSRKMYKLRHSIEKKNNNNSQSLFCVSNAVKSSSKKKREAQPKKKKKISSGKSDRISRSNSTTKSRTTTTKCERIIRGTTKSNVKFKHKNYIAKRTKFANPCWYCKRTDFSSPADCVEHTKEEHLPKNNKLALVCVRCSKICFDDKYLTSHMQRCELIPSGVILPKSFQCTECSRSFGSKKGLQAHMLHHSTDRPFPCDECSYHGKTVLALNLHKANKHPLESGQQQEQSRVKCDDCGIYLKNESLLKSHKINMHTPDGYKKYRERQKVLLASLKSKRQMEAAQRSTVCPDCKVDLYSRLAFINHRQSFHGDNMGKSFVCDQCGRAFTKASSLKLHINRVHSDERPFLCGKCGKKFKASHNLRNHDEQTHTTEGRLKYNAKMRERNRRRKLLESQLAKRKLQSPTQMFIEGVVETEPLGQNL